MGKTDETGGLYSPQPMSNSGLRRLGEAVAADRKLTQAEDDLWKRFSVDAAERTTAATLAMQALLAVPWFEEMLPRVADARVTGRPKTRRTLAEKLRRTPAIKLPAVHDTAGVRLVGRFGVFEQMQLAGIAKTFFDAFLKGEREALLLDRIESPSSGYRAIHLVIWPEGRPVELQFRTDLQHAWAETMEVLTDRWGREPRYGLPVDHPDDQERDRRQSVIDRLISLSTDVARFEDAAQSSDLGHVHPSPDSMASRGIDVAAIENAQRIALEVEPEVESYRQQLLRAIAQFRVDADLDSDR